MPHRLLIAGLLRTARDALQGVGSGRDKRTGKSRTWLPAVRGGGRQRGYGRVSLVGAGCGDPELLTLKAARLLDTADVVIYDRLVAPAIVALAARAQCIYVGKLPGRHSVPQAEIEALILEHARRGRDVVRLKGGDPFLFGRGGEEMLSLRSRGIDVTICPGVSAGLGCAASSGIPLTRRGVADGCLFIAGRDQWGDIPLAADGGDLTRLTVVIYMGVGRLADIVSVLRCRGLPGHWPIAIVENGTTPEERQLFSTLSTVEADARREHIAAPALLIVGQTVNDAQPVDANRLAPPGGKVATSEPRDYRRLLSPPLAPLTDGITLRVSAGGVARRIRRRPGSPGCGRPREAQCPHR